MNSLIMCSAVALNIFSAPAGNTVVGEVPAYQRVYLMDGSFDARLGFHRETGTGRSAGSLNKRLIFKSPYERFPPSRGPPRRP